MMGLALACAASAGCAWEHGQSLTVGMERAVGAEAEWQERAVRESFDAVVAEFGMRVDVDQHDATIAVIGAGYEVSTSAFGMAAIIDRDHVSVAIRQGEFQHRDFNTARRAFRVLCAELEYRGFEKVKRRSDDPRQFCVFPARDDR